ncbi:peptidylprolyl isomerase [bacterium]|nr:peptidylprolyl isomerase [bacterium]
MAFEVRASHILVKTEDQIATLVERLSKGEVFEELAEKCSLCPSRQNGGDLGYFERGEMVKEFEDACFDNEVGQIVTVETQFGWHLIKVTAKR